MPFSSAISRIRRAFSRWQGSLPSAGRFRIGKALSHPQGVFALAGLSPIRRAFSLGSLDGVDAWAISPIRRTP